MVAWQHGEVTARDLQGYLAHKKTPVLARLQQVPARSRGYSQAGKGGAEPPCEATQGGPDGFNPGGNGWFQVPCKCHLEEVGD